MLRKNDIGNDILIKEKILNKVLVLAMLFFVSVWMYILFMFFNAILK